MSQGEDTPLTAMFSFSSEPYQLHTGASTPQPKSPWIGVGYTGTETVLGKQLSRVLILRPDYKGSSLIKQI